jgi:transcriptional/translational regulatory protein YebC/TACO1
MKIIYQTETGISIIHPTGEVPIEVVFDKDVPVEYKATAKIVEDEYIPTDRTFRDAWEFDGEKISENIDKAKEIHKERLRAERKSLLEEQDALFMRALEIGADTNKIVVEKNRLRDITKLVNQCKTIDEIKAITLVGI